MFELIFRVYLINAIITVASYVTDAGIYRDVVTEASYVTDADIYRDVVLAADPFLRRRRLDNAQAYLTYQSHQEQIIHG